MREYAYDYTEGRSKRYDDPPSCQWVGNLEQDSEFAGCEIDEDGGEC